MKKPLPAQARNLLALGAGLAVGSLLVAAAAPPVAHACDCVAPERSVTLNRVESDSTAIDHAALWGAEGRISGLDDSYTLHAELDGQPIRVAIER